MTFFSKWLVFFPSSGTGHVPIVETVTHTPAPWHMAQHWQHHQCKQLLLDVPLDGVLCVCAFKMHHFAYGSCLNTFFFRDEEEDGATPSESLWTLQLKRSRVVFSNLMYFAIFLQNAVTENLNQVYNLIEIVGFVFGSLVCTTEASNVQANLPLFPVWISSVCCRGEDQWSWWGWWSPQVFVWFRIRKCTTIHKTIQVKD